MTVWVLSIGRLNYYVSADSGLMGPLIKRKRKLLGTHLCAYAEIFSEVDFLDVRIGKSSSQFYFHFFFPFFFAQTVVTSGLRAGRIFPEE